MDHDDLLLEPPLVGRTAEKAVLLARADELRTGRGSAVHLSGEAGVGKTRLVRETLADAAVPVAWGAAEEAEQGRPFAAWARALDIALPLQTTLQSTAINADPTWLAVDQVLGAIEARATVAPFAIVLDDLQWADAGSWAAAAATARRAGAIGVLLICIHRPARPSAPFPVPLDALGDAIELEPLSPTEATRLAAEVRGTVLGAAEIAQVGRAGGNPFFTIEIARWLADHDESVWAAGTAEDVQVSELLRSTILARVDGLTPETITVLRSAALLGRRADLGELATLTSMPVDVVARCIEDAAAVGLLADEARGVSFRHDLVRAAIRAAIPPAAIAAHHRLSTRAGAIDPWAAQQLAMRSDVGDDATARIALQAARGPDVTPESACDLLREVLRIGVPDEEPFGAVQSQLVIAEALRGDLAAAAAVAHDFLGSLPADADPVASAGLRRDLARIDLGLGRVGEAADALEVLATIDSLDGQRAQADLHLLDVMSMRRPEVAEQARELSRATSDPIVRCNADLAVAVHAMRAGRLVESVEAAGSAVGQVALEPMLTAEIHPEIFLANALFYAERFDEASAAVEHAATAATRAQVVWPIPHHLANIAGSALRTGDLETCRTASSEAIEWSLDTGQRIGATWPHVFQAVVGIYSGEIDEARHSLALAEADLAAGRWQGTEAVPWAAALVAEWDGEHARAATSLTTLLELAAAFGWKSRIPLLAPEAARMAWLAGDTEALGRLVSIAETVAEIPTVEARTALVRCRGFAEESSALLVEAAREYATIGSAAHEANSLAEAAVMASRTGDHDGGLALLEEEARPKLDAIGASGVIERSIATMPVRVQRRTRRQRPKPAYGLDALTGAEQRVLALVATGASNTEIADELVVSRRTVESHLSRIYRKMEVDSRARLVAISQA